MLEHQVTSGFAVTLDLQKIAGLGIHITEVYPYEWCYLKGLFNAVESFRDGRDVDGWHLARSMDLAKLLEMESKKAIRAHPKEYPYNTCIMDELKSHVKALLLLFSPFNPLALSLRPSSTHKLH